MDPHHLEVIADDLDCVQHTVSSSWAVARLRVPLRLSSATAPHDVLDSSAEIDVRDVVAVSVVSRIFGDVLDDA